ncbi:S-adenosyl-L-methionine-dependent methyltransferase [Dichomitus squalens LYAD-421 SS1]|uniref:S-adenosyl-L-methionine-dependent methyltransferase n=1 Tax=Dichomitus squalens (strain LYAD-421) TaxID=732165 RepID=R7SMM9_DICSQ|nr:S-adenosyl-L-methionine-dependent methyltransferase [Dichomitus squalens LYAD-421 SS1]EJF57429.1 S-adenosyl-L-methionine-dependent methyltransferase [Dichomitus squalens LYAD-421 SS1]
MTFTTLRALHAAIGTAIDDIERVYRERTPNDPIEFPSLDEPYYYAAQHRPEEELAEALKGDPAVAAASKRIVAACGQLATTVNKPWYGLMEDVQAGQFSAAIRFLEAANIVEILREAGPEGLHVREIYRLVLDLRANSKTATTADTVPLTPAHLSHILRLLATGHYLREVKPDIFANNRPSSYIDSGKTVAQLREAPEKKYNDTDGVAAFVALTYWALPDKRSLRRTDTTEGQVARYGAPFNLAFNTQLGYFPWLELPENEDRFVRFGHAMTGTRQWEIKNQILQGFSWEDLPQGSVLIDVGGGIGAQSILVAQAHPHIHVVVEDREQVVSTAQSAWGPQYAELFDSGRMSWRPRDFFQPWPALTLPALGPIAAPSVFLLRLVLHDWRDEDCRKILSQLRGAAGPETKLLIGDMLLPNACADQAAYEGADGSAVTFPFVTKESPLLPNLGVANIHGYLIDIMMMGMFDAKERTEDEMAALALSAGWKFVEVRRTPGSMWAYTTAVPV